MKLFIFCWYDKVDKTFIADSIRIHRSKRAMCRGFITEFEQNKKMNPKEFDLCVVGEFSEETGCIVPYSAPEILDPACVYEKIEKVEEE